MLNDLIVINQFGTGIIVVHNLNSSTFLEIAQFITLPQHISPFVKNICNYRKPYYVVW